MAYGCATVTTGTGQSITAVTGGTGTPEYASEQSGNNFYNQSTLTNESQESTYTQEGEGAGEVIKGVFESILVVFYMLLLFAPLSAL